MLRRSKWRPKASARRFARVNCGRAAAPFTLRALFRERTTEGAMRLWAGVLQADANGDARRLAGSKPRSGAVFEARPRLSVRFPARERVLKKGGAGL
jgi:hypothetical protein